MSIRTHNILVAGLLLTLLLLAAVTSWPALSGPFLFDDFPNLAHLATLDGKTDWQSLARYASRFEGQPGRPLSMLSFVINDSTWPSDPWSFKFTNLQLHLLIGVVVFGLARSLARLSMTHRDSDLAALFVAAAWLLHPMQLSTTMLVIQRMTQLATLFALAGLWAYVVLATRAMSPRTAGLAIACLGTGTVLALLSKENGALAPLLALVINLTLLRPAIDCLPRSSRRILAAGVCLPVAALVGALAWRWDALTWYGTRDFTLVERLMSQARALVEYLYRIVVPGLHGSGIYHDDFAVSRGLWDPPTTFPAIVVVVAAAAIALHGIRRHPLFSFGVLWFLGGHLLESTVFPLELYFEHRNYLPMFGVLFAVVAAALRVPAQWKMPAVGALVTWLCLSALLTFVQAQVWGSAGKLATIWALEHPNSPRAVQQYADHLARSGQPLAAGEVLINAHRRGVMGGAFPLQALFLACTTGDTGLGDVVRSRLITLAEEPYETSMLDVASALRRATYDGTCPALLDEAGWIELTDQLLANPHYQFGAAQAFLRIERAYLFRDRGNLGATMREFEAAWAVHPSPDLAHLMATTLASAGLFDEAEAWARRALDVRAPGVRGWLSGDEARTRRLIEALRETKHRDESQSERGPA